MRKKRRALLLGLMSLFLVGGVATTLALTYNGANTNLEGSADGAVYLKWGENTLPDIGDLVAGTPKYQDVTLDADKSTNVTGSAKVTFTLSEIDSNSTLTGLSVAIYHGTKGEGVEGMTLIDTLTSSNLSEENVVELTSNSIDREYRLAITYDGSMAESGKTIEGKITVSLDFVQ